MKEKQIIMAVSEKEEELLAAIVLCADALR